MSKGMKINGGKHYHVYITIYDYTRSLASIQTIRWNTVSWLIKVIHTRIKIKACLRYSCIIYPTQKPNDIKKRKNKNSSLTIGMCCFSQMEKCYDDIGIKQSDVWQVDHSRNTYNTSLCTKLVIAEHNSYIGAD